MIARDAHLGDETRLDLTDALPITYVSGVVNLHLDPTRFSSLEASSPRPTGRVRRVRRPGDHTAGGT